MALHLTGLGIEDVAEVVECLLLGAEHSASHAPGLADRRRALANRIGDALDLLPAPTTREEHP
ncbi:hypothetical protein ABZ904_08510 [Streptomyces sp. NPDC046900]|uniref:hypothetical protein n=1 Tax=Streptomyces sp. NPDC046900 TaxID=3155473 RepID=UPI0033EEE0EC